MSEKILQNTLAEATTEQGFPTKVGVPVQREVELEDGTVVTVESVTPDKMATILKSHFVTPGEKYQDNGLDLNGVVQNYNEEDEPEPEPEPEPEINIQIGHTYRLTPKTNITKIDPPIVLSQFYDAMDGSGITLLITGGSSNKAVIGRDQESNYVYYFEDESDSQDVAEYWDGEGWYDTNNQTKENPTVTVLTPDTITSPDSESFSTDAMTILLNYFDVEDITE